MLNPGIKNLCNFNITNNTPAVGEIATPIEDLEGMVACGVMLFFQYGSAGSSAKAYLQTSFDQGNTWFDIACVTFTTATKMAVINFSALTPKITFPLTTPSDGSLADDSAIDGWLGDRLRVKLKTTGAAYAATSLTGRLVAR